MRCTCKAVQMHRCRWLLFIFIQPVWEFGMWMQEYWGKGWQVNTAGYLCVSVYSPSCGFTFGSKSRSYVFLSGGREQLFPKKVLFGDTLGALDTFQCLRSSTNFLINVCRLLFECSLISMVIRCLSCPRLCLRLRLHHLLHYHLPPTLCWAFLTIPSVFPAFVGGATLH